MVDAAAWSARAVRYVALFTRKTGNHVCRPDVCHKGRIGKRGFCRMLFGICADARMNRKDNLPRCAMAWNYNLFGMVRVHFRCMCIRLLRGYLRFPRRIRFISR